MTQPPQMVYHVDLTRVAELGLSRTGLIAALAASGAANAFLFTRFVAERELSTQLSEALQKQVTFNHAKRLGDVDEADPQR